MTKKEKEKALVIGEKESREKLEEIVKRFNPEMVSVEVDFHWKQSDDFLSFSCKDAVKHWRDFAEHFIKLTLASIEIASILTVCGEHDDVCWGGGTHKITGEVKPTTAFKLFKIGYVTLDGGYWDEEYLEEKNWLQRVH